MMENTISQPSGSSHHTDREQHGIRRWQSPKLIFYTHIPPILGSDLEIRGKAWQFNI